MKEQDLLAALETLSRYMGHDMKGPLRAIRFYSESGNEESTEYLSKDYFDKISSAGDKMSLLLRQSHIELRGLLWLLNPTETDVGSIIREICSRFELTPNFRSTPPKIKTNYSLCFELIEIILRNSRTWIRGNKEIEIRSSTDTEHLLLSIKDYGEGLSDKGEVEKIFFPGFVLDQSDSRSGEGFGLYFAQLIMQKIGGSIEITSIKDQNGAQVDLKFPF